MSNKRKSKLFCVVSVVGVLTLLVAGLSGDAAMAVAVLGNWLIFKEFDDA